MHIKFKSILKATLMAAGMVGVAQADELWLETFETDGQGTRYTASTPFNDGVNDHWNRTDGTDISNISGPYTGFGGGYFWAAEDTDDNGGNGLAEQSLEINAISITGYTNLRLSGLFGAGNNSGSGTAADGGYDANDYLIVQYRVDSSDPLDFVDALCFNYENHGDTSNEPIGLDADCDGTADVLGSNQLTTNLQEFGIDLAVTGNLLDLRVLVNMESAKEEIAFDDIKLTGDLSGVDNPPQVVSTTPADMATGVAIDANVQIVFNEEVFVDFNGITQSCTLSGATSWPQFSGTSTIDLNPSDFIAGETCTFTLTASLITDVDGNNDQLDGNADGIGGDDYVFSFTVEPDLPPVVVATTPAEGSVGFDKSADLIIEFSEAINATSAAVTLNCSQSGTVGFAGLPVNANNFITINPNNDLIDAETCDLGIVAAAVSDTDGTADNMAEDVLVSFTVGYPVVEIFTIQGSGMSSPMAGTTVATQDNIVTAVGSAGFYMQTPDARDDGVLATSNGIYVYTGGAPTVVAGDSVNVTGDVVEFFNLTEFANPSSQTIVVNSQGNPLPTALLLDENFPSTDPAVFDCGDAALQLECFEGMYFEMPQGFVSAASVATFFAGSDGYDVYVKAGASRAFREPGIEYPGLPGLPVFDGNPELIEMSIDALALPYQPLSAGSEIALKGVISFGFGDYELQPTELTMINENIIPAQVRAASIDEFTIASANIQRLFDPIDDPGAEDDDQIEDPVVYANRMLKLAEYVVNDMQSPTIIALQEIENLNVLNDLIAAVTAAGGPAYNAELMDGNDQGGIDVAYLYQTDLLSNVTVTQLGATELNTFDGSLLHDRPPLRLAADVAVGSEAFAVNVLVVHMRSRGGIDDNADGERVRSKRLQQANSVAAMVSGILTGEPNTALYVVGDFNAFQFTDGYVDVVGQITGQAVATDNLVWSEPLFADSPLTQAVQTLPTDQQYSFVYRGSAQVLDNAIMNDAGLMGLNDVQFVRGQADANINFEDDNSSSLRSTDHDALLLYIKGNNDLIYKHGFE